MSGSKRLALLIGVGKYKYAWKPWALSNLRGPENDIMMLGEMLEQYFRFEILPPLASQAADRAAIRAAFDRLTDIVSEHPGNTVVFHYSGHGSQAKDADYEEIDRYDEILCPYDYGPDKDIEKARAITDDELHARVRTLIEADRDLHLFCIIDSCHSGTSLRGDIGGVRSRLAPPPIPASLEQSFGRVDDSAKGPTVRWLPRSEDYALLTACSAKQVAREWLYIYNGQQMYFGTLTYFLLQELNRMLARRHHWSYQTLWKHVSRRVNAQFPSQNPQFEGAANLPVFGLDWDMPPHFFVVPRIARDVAEIEAGSVHGLAQGTELTITGKFGKEHESASLEALRARRANGDEDVWEIDAKIDEKPGIVKSRARLERPLPRGLELRGQATVKRFAVDGHSFTMGVFVDVDGEIAQQLEQGIEASSLLHKAGKEDKDKWQVQVHLDEQGQIWLCYPGGRRLLDEPFKIDDQNMVSSVCYTLEKIARYYNVIEQLDNQDSASRLGDDIIALKMQRLGEGTWHDVGEQEALKVGDRVRVTVNNQHDEPLYVTVLQCFENGKVDLLYPDSGQDNWVGGCEKERNRGEERNIGTFDVEAPCGKLVLKLIATERPTTFYIYLQPGLERLRLRGEGTPLDQLLKGIMTGITEAKDRLIMFFENKNEMWGTDRLDLWIVDERTSVETLLTDLPERYCPDFVAEGEVGHHVE